MTNRTKSPQPLLRFLVFFILGTILVSCKKDKIESMGTSEFIQGELSAPERLDLFQADSAVAFYENRGYVPVWSDDSQREDFIETLRSSEDEGLYMEDYHGEVINENMERLMKLNEEELSRFDIILTDAFFKYSDHLFYGKLNPKDFHEIWDVPREKINKKALLEEVIRSKDFEVALNKLRPAHQIYHQLIASSKEYREKNSNFEGFENIPQGETIKHDMQDPRISQIQSRLEFFGYLGDVDSTFTQNSGAFQEAVKQFQQDNGIEVDGVIGNGTISFLNKGYDARFEQIQVNLERWRWYPRDLGEHYILVNIANYNLKVVKEGDTVHTHKTMVGTEARKTPVFSEEIDHIVYNPTWTIPPTIKSKDVIPGMQNNKNYLANKKINVYDAEGKQVNPSRINWSSDKALSYTYMQDPGDTNPLGRVKIMYPNQYLIYLHDTPAQALFERDSRAQSSGCVRVENAVELSKYLLQDQKEYSSKEIDEIIASGKTKQINMKQKVKVYHFYWTAWREDGVTRFTEDVYNYDDKIYAALKRAS